MANLNQFYKGEAITVTVKDDDGKALVGEYNKDGELGGEYAGVRTYPDDLNLENGDENKIFKFTTEDGIVFSIDGNTSKGMVDGQYTIELIYGNDQNDRVIVKSIHAFTLVGSAFNRLNP